MIASPSLGLAPTVGVGLRAPHTANLLAGRSALEWLEIHSENYFSAGGPHLHALQKIRRDHAISAHGVGLSLGSAQALSERHLARLEHLCVGSNRCWSPNISPGVRSTVAVLTTYYRCPTRAKPCTN